LAHYAFPGIIDVLAFICQKHSNWAGIQKHKEKKINHLNSCYTFSMKNILLIILSLISFLGKAQQTLLIKLKDKKTDFPVASTIKVDNKSFFSDSSGIAVLKFPGNGNFNLHVTAIGYEENRLSVTIPYSPDTLLYC
jgi:hypothetical protein